MASIQGDAAGIQAALAGGASVVARFDRGATALYLAAKGGVTGAVGRPRSCNPTMRACSSASGVGFLSCAKCERRNICN